MDGEFEKYKGRNITLWYNDGNSASRKDGLLLDITDSFVILKISSSNLKGKTESSDVMIPIGLVIRMEARGG